MIQPLSQDSPVSGTFGDQPSVVKGVPFMCGRPAPRRFAGAYRLAGRRRPRPGAVCACRGRRPGASASAGFRRARRPALGDRRRHNSVARRLRRTGPAVGQSPPDHRNPRQDRCAPLGRAFGAAGPCRVRTQVRQEQSEMQRVAVLQTAGKCSHRDESQRSCAKPNRVDGTLFRICGVAATAAKSSRARNLARPGTAIWQRLSQ